MMDMNRLIDLRCRMVSLIGKTADSRPFVCEGSPFECEVFLVGLNPASAMSGDFWEFWSDDYGFDKRGWFEAYKQERRNRPLAPGKKRKNEISNTRSIIEWVIEEAHPVKCLETNIYAKPSKDKKELKAFLKTLGLEEQKRLIAPFDYLLQQIKPKLVVAYGDDAVKYLKVQNLESELKCEPQHFARRWSEKKARELGIHIRKACTA